MKDEKKFYARFGRLNSAKVKELSKHGYKDIEYFFLYLNCKSYIGLSARDTIKVFKRMSNKYRYCYKLDKNNVAYRPKKGLKQLELDNKIDNEVYVFTDICFDLEEQIYDNKLEIGLSKHFIDAEYYKPLIEDVLKSMKSRGANIDKLREIISSFNVLPTELEDNENNYNEFYWRLLLYNTDIYKNNIKYTSDKFQTKELAISVFPYQKLDFEYIEDIVISFVENPTKEVAEEIYYFTEDETLYEYTLRHIEELQEAQEQFHKEEKSLSAIFKLDNKFKSNPNKWKKIQLQYEARKESLNYSYKYDNIYNAYHIMLNENVIEKCKKLIYEDIDTEDLQDSIDTDKNECKRLQSIADHFEELAEQWEEEQNEENRLKKLEEQKVVEAEEERQKQIDYDSKLCSRFFNLTIDFIEEFNVNNEQKDMFFQYQMEVKKFGTIQEIQLDYIDAFFELFDSPQDNLKEKLISDVLRPFEFYNNLTK